MVNAGSTWRHAWRFAGFWLILIDMSALHADPTLGRPYSRLLLAAARMRDTHA
jgi:hypothetical protein